MNTGLVSLNEKLGNLIISNEVFAEDSTEKKERKKIEQIAMLSKLLISEDFFST